MAAEAYADPFGPPSSPPIMILLATSKTKQQVEVIRYNITENPRVPAGTTYISPLFA